MFEPCLKLGAQSAKNCKMACAYLVELENRMRIGGGTQTPSLPVRMTAVDSALSRNVNYMGVNLANRNYRKKRKIERPTISKRGCRTCRDVFREGPSVYIGHRSGSTRCPNNGKTIDVMNDTCLQVIGDEVPGQLKSPPEEAIPETELADRFIAKCLPVRGDEVPGQLKSPSEDAHMASELDDQIIIADKKALEDTVLEIVDDMDLLSDEESDTKEMKTRVIGDVENNDFSSDDESFQCSDDSVVIEALKMLKSYEQKEKAEQETPGKVKIVLTDMLNLNSTKHL